MNKPIFEIYGKFGYQMSSDTEYFKIDMIESNPKKDCRDLIALNVVNMTKDLSDKESTIKTLTASITTLVSAYYDELEKLKETE